MHDFLTMAFLGLAVFTACNFLEDLVPALRRYHGFVMLVLAIGTAQWLDYSFFHGFDVAIRNADYGTWVTGVAIAGTTSVWRGMLHWMGTSEGEEPETRQSHMRLAA